MIRRVFGKANDFEIILEKKANDRYEAKLPGVVDGQYIIELWAEDEAGNKTYVAKAMILVKAGKLKICLLPDHTHAQIKRDHGKVDYINDEYEEKVVSKDLSIKVINKEFLIDIIMPITRRK